MAGGGAVSLFFGSGIRPVGDNSEGFNMNEPIGNCEICNAEVPRNSRHHEWTDCKCLLCWDCSASHETAELRELGFEVSE
jgi:hypothetical protein